MKRYELVMIGRLLGNYSEICDRVYVAMTGERDDRKDYGDD